MTQTTFSLPAGLNHTQVAQNRALYGTNGLTFSRRTGFFKKLLESLSDPIIKILLAALAANLLFLFRGEGWFETVGIALAVFLASFISTLSEYSSEAAFSRLQQEAAALTCRVRREGRTVVIPCDQLVRDDLVLLEGGEGVPADGVLLTGGLTVDQSALNGESQEAEKRPAPGQPLPERFHLEHSALLFRSSTATGGKGVMQVLRIGDRTLLGSMAQSLREEPRESPLKLRLEHLAKNVSRLGYLAAALVAGADLFQELVLKNHFTFSLIWAEVSHLHALLEILLHAATLAISIIIVAVPEGLPMMITVVLSRSMLRMQKDRVMVRKLTGIETAGSLNLLFSDKTGTLTRGKLRVEHLLCADGSLLDERGLRGCAPLLRETALCCRLGNSAERTPAGVVGGNATDQALLLFTDGWTGGLPPLRQTVAFDSARKYSAAAAGNQVYYKGAPELLLPRCRTGLEPDGALRPLYSGSVDKWHSLAAKGCRVVALCRGNELPPDGGLPEGLTLLGLAVIRDGLRPQTKAAVAQLRRAGIQLVMMTGDSPDTARSIAAECGLLSPEGLLLTGSDLAEMTDQQLREVLPRLQVLARVLPTDKSRLVRIAQQTGLVVGMTGDGINDAPALRLADVGFAMGSGTQVAKEAGDIIILDDNIASISRAVLYGRTIFRSIQRFIVFQLTMNLCAVAVSLIGPLIGVDSPVTVIQMLWINLIMDTLAGLAFAGEPPAERWMEEPPKRREAPVLTRPMIRQIVGMGAYTVILCLGYLKLPPVRQLFSGESEFLTGFFALFVFCGILNGFCARTEDTKLLRNLGGNPSFLGIMTGVALVQILLVYFGGALFRTVWLPPAQLVLIAAAAATVIPADLVRKHLRSFRS